jgi:hypothetical protein
VAIRQDVVSTGHVASLDGDVAPVKGISTKLGAAIQTPGVSAFIVPDLDKDRSMKLLTPLEYKGAQETLLARKGEIRIHSIRNIYDAIKILMDDESIVRGSLKSEFFDTNATASDTEGILSRVIAHLAVGNEKRFWDGLGDLILNHHIENAHSLLRTYADFHTRNQRYPEKFGEKLFRLAISLPPLTRNLDGLFPLLPMASCIKLSQHANENDHEDVRQLYKAAFNGRHGVLPRTVPRGETIPLEQGGDENDLIERVLEEISEENLTEKVALPVDEARLSYVSEKATVHDGFEFNDAITAFYVHMFRHIESPSGNMNRDALAAEAIDLVQRAFDQKGGYKAALAEGTHGANGGMRAVLDSMTERLKQEERAKCISRGFKEAIDPLDWDAKVRLMEVFIKRIEPELPPDLKDIPPKKLASHWETVLQCYAESRDRISDFLKRL